MKIYLAARYRRREQLCAVRCQLVAMGHSCTSRWIDTDWPADEDRQSSSAAPPAEREKFASMDAEDVCAADCVVSFTEPEHGGRGGRHVEFGMAAALGKMLVVVGRPEHVFHHLPDVTVVPDVESLWMLLRPRETVVPNMRTHEEVTASPLSMTVRELVHHSHATAVEKGWWKKDRPFSEGIALMHSELSEALEEWRVHGLELLAMLRFEDGKPEGIAVELADVLIRIGDWCGKHSIPLEAALRAKMAYNRTRPHRHGGKLA